MLVWYDPTRQDQLVPGFALGGKSCTCFAGATGVDRNTFGKTIITGKKVRIETGDTIGGTTIQQVDDAIARLIGEDDFSTGYWQWDRLDHALQNGKGLVVAIRYRGVHRYQRKLLAQLGHIAQEHLIWGSELFGSDDLDWHAEVWHRWLAAGTTTVLDGKTLAAPPHERGLIVGDPLCDGRRSTVAKGYVVYPESLVRAIAADSLLFGKTYAAILLDARYEVADKPPTVPVRTLQYGGKAIKMRRLRTVRPANLRERPRRNRKDPSKYRVRYLPKGSVFRAWQKAEGTMIGGSNIWYGNRGGDLWLHSSRF